MAELIKRQDAIDVVAKAYRYESDRMTALQELTTTTEEEIRAKAIDEFVEMLRPIMAEFRKNKNPHAFIDINRIAEQLKWKSTYSKYVQEELEEER